MAVIQYSPKSSMCGGPVPKTGAQPFPESTTAPLELHSCMGLNACRGHDRFGTNNCAGTGFCATAAAHTCHTLNNCRGQGGCGLYGSAEEQDKPCANECCWQGSCAVPIQAERYSTLGSNTGKSVWLLARQLFEHRMAGHAQRSVGKPPFVCGPPQSWLTSLLGQYDSCGNSGNKVCSFGFNNADDHAKILCQGGTVTAEAYPKK